MRTSLFAAFAATLALATAWSAEPETDIVYGEAGGQRLLLDAYLPAGAATTPRAGILLVHGGAWSAGDKSDFAEIAGMIALQGYAAFSIGYRLVTDTGNRWPAQLEDAQQAVRWVRAHAERFGVDPRRLGAIGGSAGGHIVAALGTSDAPAPVSAGTPAVSSRIACSVVMAGPTDLTEDFAPLVAQGAWTNEQIARLLGGAPSAVPAVARSASPLLLVDGRSAPALIIQGRNDEVVPWRQAERFAAALTAAGVEAKLVLHDGGHDLADEVVMARCIAEMDAFLKRHLHP